MQKNTNIHLQDNSKLYSDPGGKVNILGGRSIGHSKQKSVYGHVSYLTELFHYTVPNLLIRKRYYILFLIPVFTVQVTKLVQSTYNNTFQKFHHKHHRTLQLV
jgi:hypothetical protein